MRKVKCQYCGNLVENDKVFFIVKETAKTTTKKYYCNEQCYNTQQSNIYYRKLVIGSIYKLLNIKFQDGGSLVNKKLKELESYTMEQIYNVLQKNELEIQMCVPTDGILFGRISYLFKMLQSMIYDEYENTQKEVEQKVQQKCVVSDYVEEEVIVPMKRRVKKQEQEEIQELTIDF